MSLFEFLSHAWSSPLHFQLHESTNSRFFSDTFVTLSTGNSKGFRSSKYMFLQITIAVLHCSVTQSCPTLWPHGLQHAKLPCPSLSPGVCSNSCPLSRWCHPAISSSVVPSPPAPNPSQHQGLFQWVNFAWGGQSTGVSALASFLPKKSVGWSPSECAGWISLQSKGLSNSLLQHHSSNASILWCSVLLQSSSHIHTWPLEKP